MNSRNFRRDRPKGAADFIRNIFFGIPEVEVTRTALHIHHNNVFRATPTGRSRLLTGQTRRGRLGAEHIIEGHADEAAAADAENIAAGDAQMAVTKIFSRGTGYTKHGSLMVEEEFR